MASGDWGRQPAKIELFKQQITATEAAQRIGVSERHLRNVLNGKTRPRREVREQLPVMLGIPLSKLFTRDILAKPYDPSKAWGVAS